MKAQWTRRGITPIKVAVLAFTLSTVGLMAADHGERAYLGVDGGLTLLQDVRIKNADGFWQASVREMESALRDALENELVIPDAQVTAGAPRLDDQAEFDPGWRAGLLGGYRLSEKVAVELEAGVLRHPVDKWLGVKPGQTAQIPLQTPEGSITLGWPENLELYQVPVLANLLFEPRVRSEWTPYAGAGVGVVFAIFNVDGFDAQGSATTPSGTVQVERHWPGQTDTDIALAYQAMLGVRYLLGDREYLGVSYRFLGTTGHEWRINGHDLKTEPLFSHSLLASFTYEF